MTQDSSRGRILLLSSLHTSGSVQPPSEWSFEARAAAIAEILRRHAGRPGVEFTDSIEDMAGGLVAMLPAMRVEHLLELFSGAGQIPMEPYRPLAEELVAWQDRLLDLQL
ncbi:MAG TPA: hypothetical protein VFH97_09815 [Gemmatimonadales bacterium]|nr:hypothetical protein [Gemmatimonadales bacterium]